MSKKSIKDKEVLNVIGKVMKISKNKITKDLKLGSIPEIISSSKYLFSATKSFQKKNIHAEGSKREVCERLD